MPGAAAEIEHIVLGLYVQQIKKDVTCRFLDDGILFIC
jgi:hypothetical protein